MYTFVSQTALFLGNCHSFRELLIPAAKIQIISENLVQLSENRINLTILSINQCTILLKMAFFSIFQCFKIWLYPIFVLLLHPKSNDMRYRRTKKKVESKLKGEKEQLKVNFRKLEFSVDSGIGDHYKYKKEYKKVKGDSKSLNVF